MISRPHIDPSINLGHVFSSLSMIVMFIGLLLTGWTRFARVELEIQRNREDHVAIVNSIRQMQEAEHRMALATERMIVQVERLQKITNGK